ncbi:hypothetical protein QYE76_036692 [Lolium multiflorum]|uniref:Transposase (putative) gypsy type domain-containing protein n=1 Tax=Lolium multiflorum TaxID=4521 RepID=A0AAD8R4W3_LOLMU|nr:hypothetical protein QYE76_036692 [Lolium multiflorum]
MPRGRVPRRPLPHFVFLAPPLLSLSSSRSSPLLLRRASPAGELRRANLRRSAAATPSSRRHGAPRFNGASSAAAVATVARLFFALSPFVVLLFFFLDDGLRQRIRGSYMREDDIERLVRLRRIPSSVVTRAPGEETEPEPQPGERVVFGAHLDRGLGLPASNFFRQFLDNFGLQPHHLPANACILLSCYVAFMEAYAGLWPDIDFWSRLFYLKAQTTEGRLRACGAASIYTRPGTPFPKIPTVDSVKNWQMSFFYVRNEGGLVDRINLPEFNPAPPVGRINWSYNARTTDPDAEVNQLWDFLGAAIANGLTAEDLLCTIAERRVLPLQMRTHKIGHMSGRFDPTRTSRAPLSKAQVAHRVNNITKANMPEEWNYGLAPRDRDHQPELLFNRQNVEDGDLATRRWTPDHADPAGQAGDQVGDDDLLQAPDLGGQGEHNPPPSPEQQEEEEPATSATGPIPAVPLRARPPSTTATSAPKGKKRVGSTAALEAKAKKLRRLQPRKVPEQAGAPIKFAQGGGSRPAPRVVSPLPRQRRESTPQPPSRAPTPPPPAGTPPPAGASSSAVPLATAPGHGTRAEPTHQPTLDDMFPRRARLLDQGTGAGLGMPPSTGAGASGAAPPATGAGTRPDVVVLEGSPEGEPQAPEVTAPTGPSASPGAPPPPEPTLEEPARQEPARDEPVRMEGADSRALVRTGAPSAPQQGLHVAKGALLLHVPSASDSSLGSAGTMEQAWLRADSYEVTSREGNPGQASVEMFFSSLQANLKARAAEAAANLAKVEEASKAVADRRTNLYNRAVTHYHKAKLDRADLARELEAVKVEAAKVPGLEADLRAARAQWAESEEAGRSAAAKLNVAEQELTRLRRLEQNHLTELASLRTAEKEKVEDLSRRLTEVEKQRLALQEEVTTKTKELSATAKRWVDEIGALDRGLSAAFPETQDAALAAVGVARESRRRATGEGSSEYFTMEDYMASMAARVEPITKLGWELRKAAEELVPMLWPAEAVPQDISNLTSLMEQAPERFLDWKDSATRAGADMALSFVLSWYNEVDLGQLEYRRADVEGKLPAEYKAARLARASAIAEFVDKSLFVADPDPQSDEEYEMGDEEAEDAPGDDPAAGPSDAPPAGP